MNFLIHNYFPPTKIPFVLNLSSGDKIIQKKSIKLAINAIRLSRKLGSKFYGFHAGFLIDPIIKSLGKKIVFNNNPLKRSTARKNFIKSVKILSKHAKMNNINLLIENNVLTKKNYKLFGYNPLLCVENKEINLIMKQMPSNVNFLLDVAHLNVSSKTLRFNKIKFLKECNKWIKAYHLSENDGLSDSNKFVSKKSWFWKHLKKDVYSFTLETRSNNLNDIKKQIKLTKSKIHKNVK